VKILAVSALIVAVAAGWWAWRRAAPPPVVSGVCSRCNVLLLTIDTLRSDRVGAFGSTRGLTPTLDRLAAEGLRLTRAYASAPLTLPSHVSIMTAASPPVHGVRNNSLFRLGSGVPTLAGVLEQNGYRTGAFVGAFVLDARFGLNRGFDVYDDEYGEHHAGDVTEGAERRAEEVIKPALAWIVRQGSGIGDQGSGIGDQGSGIGDQRSGIGDRGHQPSAISHQPWFAWVHLYDPHEPYRAPEPYASQHEPYDAEVAYTDAMVGVLLKKLAAAGQLDRTLIAFTADHGESLGEHGEATHGVFAYDVTMRVPSIVWAGSRLRPGTYDGLARLIDLAPTILDLVGITAPPAFEGQSLRAAINNRAADHPAAYIEAMDASLTRNWAPLTGLVSGQYKLIDLPIPELYDLSADPHEQTNLFARDGERARSLAALLRDRIEQFAARGSHTERAELNADARQRLQALGYIATAAAPPARAYTEADDPKQMIAISNEVNRIVAAFNAARAAGHREEAMNAMAALRRIADAHPAFSTASGMLASMQRDTGDLPGAIATLEDIVRRNIADQSVMLVLAGDLLEAGSADKALALVDAVIAAHPDYAEAYNSQGVIEMRLGRHDRARAAFSRVIELDPTSATAYANRGADEIRSRQMTNAIADLRQAVALDPRQYDALYNLGMALAGEGKREEARPLLEQFVRDAPPARYAVDIARLRAVLK
jgi:arylsulfatase A-like enzyme/Flp pilus assembly protein TadD